MQLFKLKSLVKVVALFVMLTTAGTALFATDVNPGIVVTKGNQKSFALHLNYQTERSFKIALKDAASTTLFKENVKQAKAFAKNFDLKNLPDGTYFLQIEDQQSIHTQAIEVHGNTLTIDKSGEEKIFKPVVYKKNQKVYLTALLLDGADVEISVRDDNGDLVYREMIENQVSIEKVFSFAGQNPEDFNISVRYKNYAFEFNNYSTIPSILHESTRTLK